MADSTAGLGGFSVIVKNEGRFISKFIVALGRTERPTIDQLQGYLPAFGLLRWTRKTGQLVKWESCS